MEFNDLLIKEGINPKGVLVLRHRPSEPKLRKVFPWLAAERPDLYNAYQQTQGPKVEKAMQKADYVASFIGHEPGRAHFVGLYERCNWRPLTYQQYRKKPGYEETTALDYQDIKGGRDSIFWFDLELTDFYARWKGRLIVEWPGLERSWWRWADRNVILIDSILKQSAFDAEIPSWDELTLTWEELKVLPSKWQAALSEWRGIYFILDESDGKGYVGSAYGTDNILGRWLNYAASGHGGNKALRRRKPGNFRFSILQRVSPDMEPADITRLEASWKNRLHTRSFGLNGN